MTWIITVPGGQKIESDDFTLEHLGRAEKESDTPWSIQNPLRSAAVARAYLRTALELAGQDPSLADTLTLREIKSSFDYREDEPITGEAVGAAAPLDRSSPDYLPGAHRGSTGPRKKRANNG